MHPGFGIACAKDSVCKWYPSLKVKVPAALLLHVTRYSIFSNSSVILPGLWASIGVTRCYSSRLFLCALAYSTTFTLQWILINCNEYFMPKPISVRNKPGYIRAAWYCWFGAQPLTCFCLSKEKFLEDLVLTVSTNKSFLPLFLVHVVSVRIVRVRMSRHLVVAYINCMYAFHTLHARVLGWGGGCFGVSDP